MIKIFLGPLFISIALGATPWKIPETLPQFIFKKGKKLSINYTFKPKLQSYLRKLLRRYKSAYSALVVLDNNTGQIIGVAESKRGKILPLGSLSFKSTHPAASLFKIITAAELLENSGIQADTQFSYRGRSSTLYRWQIFGPKSKRKVSFLKAFVTSNNVVFGRAAVNHIGAKGLALMANKFGHNRSILNELDLRSQFVPHRSSYNLAELASGMNRTTLISPVHGALIAQVVANDGILKHPHIVKDIFSGNGQSELRLDTLGERVIKISTAAKLQEMMESTVLIGTASRTFRKFVRSKFFEQLRVGGKTGTLTGGIPHGRRDWFAAYAVPNLLPLGGGISICAMVVNKKRWYVRSVYLTQKVIEYYYRVIMPLGEQKK